MGVTLTVLCENTVERVSPHGLLGEHGFSCHIQTPAGDYLFDTGNGLTLLHNAKKLGIELSTLKGIICSHGHYDHTGGLVQVLKKTGEIPIFTHPDFFNERFSDLHGEYREIGVPFPRQELESLGARFDFNESPREIAPGMLLSGEIPRLSSVETGDPALLSLSDQGNRISDPLRDDQSLFIKSDLGLVILLGCAHSGLINIIDHALKTTEQKRIYMIMGGTHLKFCSDEQMTATVQRLAELNVKKLGAAHCTGVRGAHVLADSFGDRFFSASVGVEIHV